MLTRFRKYINEQNLFAADDQLLLAVSGGVDSVVLVDLCKKAGFEFVIAHMNFNLRASESARDESFVRDLADQHQVKVFVKDVDAGSYASANNLSIQEAARELRYEWFESLRISLAGTTAKQVYLLTAHHMDDSVETMMMNLFRGTGIGGLRGIEPVNGKIIRPMLLFTKEELLSYARTNELNWVEDSSNQLDKYTRNYFRNQFIPMLKGIYPNVEQNLYNNLHKFNEAFALYREAVESKIKKLVEYRGSEVHIPVRKLVKQKAWQTILFELLQPYSFSSGQSAQVARLVDSESGRHVTSETHRVIKNREWLIIAPIQQAVPNYLVIDEDDRSVNFDEGKITLETRDKKSIDFVPGKPDLPVVSGSHIAYLDADKLAFPILLRRHKTGDYFYPLGMKKKKKIARFMIDIKLSKTQKEKVWVLESGKTIIWLVGHRIDDRFKLRASTQQVLVIKTSI